MIRVQLLHVSDDSCLNERGIERYAVFRRNI